MKEITFLNTLNKAKHSFLIPFTSKIVDLNKSIRVKGAEKQTVSLRKEPEKRAVSLRNGHEK